MDKNSEDSYERLVNGALRYFAIGAPLEAVELSRQAANLAWTHSTTRFYDERIENVLTKVGRQLHLTTKLPKRYTRSSSRLNVLHVSTRLFETYGHTKLLERWVGFDTSSRHSVILTSQGKQPYPMAFREEIERRDGIWIELDESLTLLEKAAELRELSTYGADLVLLHHFPDDPIPSIAFSCEDVPPVLLVNHADHVFWIGCAIADAVVHIRSVAQNFSEQMRDVARSILLPIPIEIPIQKPARRNELRLAARQRLQLPPDSHVFLSIAAKYKFIPNAQCDFFHSVAKLLDAHPTAHCYILGVDTHDLARFSPGSYHPRLHLKGVLPHTEDYKYAADIGLLSYPIGSLTSALEIGAHGIPLVQPYCDTSEILLGVPDAINSILTRPTCEQAWLTQIAELIARPEHRTTIGAQTRSNILSHHDRNSWKKRLKEVYSLARSIRHTPRTLSSPAQRVVNKVASNQ